MTLPYWARLACLGFAGFYLVHAALALAARAAAPWMTRTLEASAPRRAALRLVALRLLPWAAAVVMVLGLCLPSYWRWEPAGRPERVSWLFLAAGGLGLALCLLSARRSLHAAIAVRRLIRACRASGREARLTASHLPLLVLESEARFLVLAGILRPRLVISAGALRALSCEQLDAALRHELAHGSARDNVQRWLWLAAPDVFPCVRGFAALERRWRRLSEWAADDSAAGGDPQRALWLAEALVCVGRSASNPPALALATALAADGRELAARIDRLLEPPRAGARPAGPTRGKWPAWTLATGLALWAGLALLLSPGALHLAYTLIESLVR